MQRGRFWGHFAAAWAVAAASGLVFSVFARTAHMGHRPFLFTCLAGFIAAALAAFLAPERRLLFFSASVFVLPRFATLLSGRIGHNVLFPVFAGLAVGLLLNAAVDAYKRRNKSYTLGSLIPEIYPPTTLITGTGAWVALLFAVDLVRFYAPCPMLGSPLIDREVTAGVSANYSTWLASHLSLSFLGPLCFLAADRAFPGRGADPRDLIKGAALGAACNVIAFAGQEAGIKRLLLGTADMGLSSARLPGLFSDTGSSAVLLPVAIFALAYVLGAVSEKQLRGSARRIAEIAWPVLILVISAPLALRQGRAFLVGVLAAFAVGVFLVFRKATGSRAISLQGRPVQTAALVFAALLLGIALVVFLSALPAAQAMLGKAAPALAYIRTGDFLSAYAAFDEPRSLLARAGFELFSRSPWTGRGLGGFAGGLSELVHEGWTVPSDNPSTLIGGLLAETGLLGTLAFFAALVLALRLLWLHRGTDRESVVWLPMLTIPAFFAGYHFLFHEFSALWAFPFLVRTLQDTWTSGKRRALIETIVLGLLAASLLFSFLALDRSFCR
ncbi:MAG: hypothetical protein HY042_12085 [Spirochaetia bacterium]|nr:hypothetical protein [Spirochaetia bacterium]